MNVRSILVRRCGLNCGNSTAPRAGHPALPHLFKSWVVLLVALSAGASVASSPPPEAPAGNVIRSVFANSADFTTVRVTTVDQLIAAMIAANERQRPTKIEVAPGTYTFTQTFNSDFGPSVLPPVTAAVLIAGRSAATTILDGLGGDNAIARALTVLEGGRLLVRNLAIRNFVANCEDDCAQNGGGAVENAGGHLRFEDCIVDNSLMIQPEGGASFGGDIFNEAGDLELERTTVSRGFAISFGGGGIAVIGGSAAIMHSTISASNADKPCCGDEGAAAGGGLYVTNAKVSVFASTIAANSVGTGSGFDEAVGSGAGIYNDVGAEMWVVDSAVLDNHSLNSGVGGGIANNGKLFILNSTIGDNTIGTLGGGVYNGSELVMQGVTLANNSVSGLPFFPACNAGGDACVTGGGGIWVASSAVAQIATSAIAGNTSRVQNTGPDCVGVLVTDGHNALGSDSLCTLVPSRWIGRRATHDLVNLDPRLGVLEENQEPGKAHFPLLADSPLIDAGGTIGRFCTPRDQLGNPRVDALGERGRKPLCDIGAIEFQPPPPQ